MYIYNFIYIDYKELAHIVVEAAKSKICRV